MTIGNEIDIETQDLRWYIGSALVHISCYLENVKDNPSSLPPTLFAHVGSKISPIGYMVTDPEDLVHNLCFTLAQEQCTHATWVSECRFSKQADRETVKNVYYWASGEELDTEDILLSELQDGIIIQVFNLQNGLVLSLIAEYDEEGFDLDLGSCNMFCLLSTSCKTAWSEVPPKVQDSLKDNNIYIGYSDDNLNGLSSDIREQIHEHLFGSGFEA